MVTTIISGAVNAILLAIAIWAIKIMISNVRKDIKEAVERLDKEDQDLWKAVNTHGHKGLNGNGARVTR